MRLSSQAARLLGVAADGRVTLDDFYDLFESIHSEPAAALAFNTAHKILCAESKG